MTEALNKTEHLRNDAIQSLGQIGRSAQSAVPQLTPLLVSESEETRCRTAKALGHLQTSSQEAIASLIQMRLQDRAKHLQNDAAEALIKIGAPAIPTLTEAVQNPKTPLRPALIVILGKIGTPAIPTLIQALHDPSDQVRWHAADALGDMKASNPNVTSALIKALSDASSKVRWEAVDTLGDTGACSLV